MRFSQNRAIDQEIRARNIERLREKNCLVFRKGGSYLRATQIGQQYIVEGSAELFREISKVIRKYY